MFEIKTPVRYDGEYIRDADNQPVGLADAKEIVTAINEHAALKAERDRLKELVDAAGHIDLNCGESDDTFIARDWDCDSRYWLTSKDENNRRYDTALEAYAAITQDGEGKDV